MSNKKLSAKILQTISIVILGITLTTLVLAQDSVVSIIEETKGKTIYCSLESGKWLPGRYNKRGKFILYKGIVSKRRKKFKRSRSLKNKKKFVSLRKLARSYTKSCSTILDNSVPAPKFPLPTVTPTPKSTSSSSNPGSSGLGFYDSIGNVTELGKTKFQIPGNLSASIAQGKVVQQNLCQECHDERTNYLFKVLRARTSEQPMFFDENTLTDQQLADLVAYLNRFQR